MDEVSYQTTAGRLYHLVILAKGIDKAKKVYDFWNEIFQVTNMVEFYERYEELLVMPSKILEELKEAGYPPERFFPYSERLKSIFEVKNITIPMLNLDARGGLLENPDLLKNLATCDYLLAEKGFKDKISDTDIDSFHEKVRDLFDQATALDELNYDLKEFILSQLNILDNGIKAYKILGEKSLKESLERVVGATIIYQDIPTKDVRKAKIGSQFLKVLHVGLTLLSFTSDMVQLDDAKDKYLSADAEISINLEEESDSAH